MITEKESIKTIDKEEMVLDSLGTPVKVEMTLYQKGNHFYVETMFYSQDTGIIDNIAQKTTGIKLKSPQEKFGLTWRTNSLDIAKKRFDSDKLEVVKLFDN